MRGFVLEQVVALRHGVGDEAGGDDILDQVVIALRHRKGDEA